MANLLRVSLATLTLLDDPANELFLSSRLGTNRILSPVGGFKAR